jgi:hypothetical protein
MHLDHRYPLKRYQTRFAIIAEAPAMAPALLH